MFKLHNLNIKFPWATYHTIVPSTEELYCLSGNSERYSTYGKSGNSVVISGSSSGSCSNSGNSKEASYMAF